MKHRYDRIYSWPDLPSGRPLNIAHRGASAHMFENTLRAFRAAADLGADMWEIDVRLSADGEPIVSHDADLQRVFGAEGTIADLSWSEIHRLAPDVPHLDDVIALASELKQALYVEAKAPGAGVAAVDALVRAGFTQAAIGSFDIAEVRRLREQGCPYSISVLVPFGADPFEHARRSGADIVHLCWEKGGERPQDLISEALLSQARQEALGVVLWHEERRSVIDDLQKLPVLGICTNNPELMAGFAPIHALGIDLVCHRGINHLAPENTIAAAGLCFEQGAEYLEVDVRETADEEIVVLHDPTLDRTTSGSGPVAERTLAELRDLDAGSWHSPFYAGERIPTLPDMIAVAQSYGRQIYIENKSVDPARLVSLVDELNFLDRCFFWSGEARLQDRLRAISPEARIKSNLDSYSSIRAMRDHLAPSIVEIGFEEYKDMAPAVRDAGMLPMMQYFGDDPAIFDAIVELRPPLLNLDRSDLLLAAAKRLI